VYGTSASLADIAPRADTAPTPIGIDDITNAAQRLRPVAHQTPVLTSRQFNTLVREDVSVFFKCENFQRVGAFKFRGAFNALATLDTERRRAGVITYSSGNHAQAVALSARLLRIPAVIVMPNDAPPVKRNATSEYLDHSIAGSEVIGYDPMESSREAIGRRIAEERGLTLVKPYDNPFVIAGQGTAALEFSQQLHADHTITRLDYLFVPCGGGGLLSGSAIAMKSQFPKCHVIGVEPASANDALLSFRDRVLHTVQNPLTIADGARTPALGRWTFPLICEHVDTMMSVSDDELRAAMHFIMERMKIVIEPTASLPVAGLLKVAHTAPSDRDDGSMFIGKPITLSAHQSVGIILSGGNVNLKHIDW
jgi:threonine dehydratase